MSNQVSQGLLVEVFMHGGAVCGYSTAVGERRRLLEVLNNRDAEMLLEDAVWRAPGTAERALSAIAIDKKSIILAVPRETQRDLRVRAFLNTGFPGVARSRMALTIFAPPMLIDGTAHLPLGLERRGLEIEAFPSFFAVTDARIEQPHQPSRDEPILLVNRDSLIAIAQAA